MPTYLPPPQPVPYVAPYVAPDGVPLTLRSAAGANHYVPAPDDNGVESGMGSAQNQTTNVPVESAGDEVSTPWPMSPAARVAEENPSDMPLPLDSLPAAKSAKLKSKKKTALEHPSIAGGAAPSSNAPLPYAQQASQGPSGYAQAPYGQQPVYRPRQAVPQQSWGNPGYANSGDAQQPYIPQPPGSYAQSYIPAQAAAPNYAAAAQNPSYGREATPTTMTNQQTLGVAAELAEINREQSSSVTAGVLFRNRAGEDGLSSVTDIETPIEGRIKAGNGHIVVTATPVTLDAGTANNQLQTLARFGSGGTAVSSALPLTTGVNNYGSQTASGVGLSIGYDSAHLKGDVGTTPLGFREQNFVGGAEYDGAVSDKVSYSLAVARRAVTDSMLSYAGASDQGAQLSWGGVTSNGARVGLSWDDGTNGVYLSGAYQYFEGTQVASNTAGKGGGGVYTRVLQSADQTLTIGMNATVEGYAKNLSYFTYGQGGYFSPQQYVLLNLPVEWSGRNGPVTYDLKGSIGVQHYRENSSNYFPTNAIDQANAAKSPNVPDAGGIYPGQSKTGLSYSFSAVSEYQLAPQLAVGATASLGNAYQYREWIAAFYVRYSFSKQGGLQPFPPSALTSPYLSLSD